MQAVTNRSAGFNTGVVALGVVVLAGAMIAVPLQDRGERAGLSVLVVCALALTTAALAAQSWGAAQTAIALAAVAVATTAIEWAGTTTGLPFGQYCYAGILRPEVFGVPAIVPLAWFAMALPAREVATRIAGPGHPVARVLIGAAALTAWDLFLDPQMVREGYWVWQDGGAYRDIPLSNYAGWLAAAALVMGLLDRLVVPRRGETALIVVYTAIAVMQTSGFLFFFGDTLVAVVGGVAMGVPTVLAWRRRPVHR